MPSVDAALPDRCRRILVAGISGTGKSTLCRRLAAALSLEYTELDSLYHGENWEPRSEFLDDVRAIALSDRWVMEFQYISRGSAQLLAPRADLIIWLDYPYRISRIRLYRRTLARALDRKPLWNGNREKPLWKLALARTPEENILVWQRHTRRQWRDKWMPHVTQTYPHLPIVRVTHPREIPALITRLSERS